MPTETTALYPGKRVRIIHAPPSFHGATYCVVGMEGVVTPRTAPSQKELISVLLSTGVEMWLDHSQVEVIRKPDSKSQTTRGMITRSRKELEEDGFMEVAENGAPLWKLHRGAWCDRHIIDVVIGPDRKSIWIKLSIGVSND